MIAATIGLPPQRLDHYLDKIEHLPPTPTLLLRLIGMIRQPDREVDEVVEVIARDPALAASMLRRCNSSFFGNDEPVADVGEAVFRLGFFEAYRVAVALFGLQVMTMGQHSPSIAVEALWRHSAETATAAGVLSRRVGEFEGVAFTAGLLHDVGKMVLGAAEGRRYATMLEEGLYGDALGTAERSAFGFDHAEVGARLLVRWGMPAEIVGPVRAHHAREWAGPEARLAAMISLADALVHALPAVADGQAAEPVTGAAALAVLGLSANDWPALLAGVGQEVQRMQAFAATGAA